jgi:hypothetical protein
MVLGKRRLGLFQSIGEASRVCAVDRYLAGAAQACAHQPHLKQLAFRDESHVMRQTGKQYWDVNPTRMVADDDVLLGRTQAREAFRLHLNAANPKHDSVPDNDQGLQPRTAPRDRA